ncbi:MAG: YlqD family protein [Candidatus Poribacteria bacterium]|nr:YlqD family protein [Candidatus Poribacteria bacterium]MDE0504966.1 YlqD family protein [Candidatus Poribacteria bacterium]
MAVIVKRPVILKNVVTESFKSQLTKELEHAINRIGQWLEQEEFQSRRLIAEAQKQTPHRVNQLREEISQERGKQEQALENLKQQLSQVEQLEIDSYFASGTYDAPVKIDVGDDIRSKLSQAEIIVKDGRVIQINEWVSSSIPDEN